MNPATQFSVFMAAMVLVLKMSYELVLLLKKQMNSNGKVDASVYCNYPVEGGGCAFSSRDFHTLRTVEMVQGVTQELRPALEQQNKILGEIRDGVWDLKRGSRS